MKLKRQGLTDEQWQEATSLARGAIDYEACPTRDRYRRCNCAKCAKCGYAKHMGIHGPLYGKAPGTKAYGHNFIPRTEDVLTAPS